jgi:transcriptional regulator with XRE-family HTH domain
MGKYLYALDERRKKWYDRPMESMENLEEFNQKLAKNLSSYRKAAGYTQAELAEKINYSDKSVSKWESGNGVPDLYVLLQLSRLYGVSVDELLHMDAEEKSRETTVENRKESVKKHGLHALIMLLSSGLVWLVATVAFVGTWMFQPNGYAWLTFICAIPVNAIVLIVYSGVWKYRFLNFLSVSALVWTVLTTLFLTGKAICATLGWEADALWGVFLLGIPLQVLEVLWVFFRSIFHKGKKEKKTTAELPYAEEQTA